MAVEACGLNPVDLNTMHGGHPTWSWPHILGLDVAGTIAELSNGVEGFVVGDRVVFHGDLRRDGGYAEFVTTRAEVLARIPDQVSFEVAAALPCAGMTAYQAIHRRLHVGAEDVVLITAGAGGVGGFAVQLAKAAGARVITTCSAYNADYVRSLGADEVIDYRAESIPQRVRELTSSRESGERRGSRTDWGVDAVLDTVSSTSATENIQLLAHGGGIATIAGGPDLSVITPFTLAPSWHEISLGAAHADGDLRARRRLAEDLQTLLAMVAHGRLDPMLADTVDLDHVPQALAKLATRHGRGKYVHVA